MVLDLRATDPEGWERDKQVALGDYTDAVIYLSLIHISAAPQRTTAAQRITEPVPER